MQAKIIFSECAFPVFQILFQRQHDVPGRTQAQASLRWELKYVSAFLWTIGKMYVKSSSTKQTFQEKAAFVFNDVHTNIKCTTRHCDWTADSVNINNADTSVGHEVSPPHSTGNSIYTCLYSWPLKLPVSWGQGSQPRAGLTSRKQSVAQDTTWWSCRIKLCPCAARILSSMIKIMIWKIWPRTSVFQEKMFGDSTR